MNVGLRVRGLFGKFSKSTAVRYLLRKNVPDGPLCVEGATGVYGFRAVTGLPAKNGVRNAGEIVLAGVVPG